MIIKSIEDIISGDVIDFDFPNGDLRLVKQITFNKKNDFKDTVCEIICYVCGSGDYFMSIKCEYTKNMHRFLVGVKIPKRNLSLEEFKEYYFERKSNEIFR